MVPRLLSWCILCIALGLAEVLVDEDRPVVQGNDEVDEQDVWTSPTGRIKIPYSLMPPERNIFMPVPHIPDARGLRLLKRKKSSKGDFLRKGQKCEVRNDLMTAVEFLGKVDENPELIAKYGKKLVLKKLEPIVDFVKEQNPDVKYSAGFVQSFLKTWIGSSSEAIGFSVCELEEAEKSVGRLLQADSCAAASVGLAIDIISLVLAFVGMPGVINSAVSLYVGSTLNGLDTFVGNGGWNEVINSNESIAVKIFKIFVFIFAAIGSGGMNNAIMVAVRGTYTPRWKAALVAVWTAAQFVLLIAGVIASAGLAFLVYVLGIGAALVDFTFAITDTILACQK